MITGNNALLNQFVPDFGIIPELLDGQVLVYDAQLKKFINKPASDLNILKPSGLENIEVFNFTGDGIRVGWTIPVKIQYANSLFITINGQKQHVSAFSYVALDDSTTITFTEPPTMLDGIEVIALLVKSIDDLKFFNTMSDGATSSFTLDWVAHGPESLFITLTGTKQHLNAYSISIVGSQTIVQFNGVPDIGESIEILGIVGDFGSTGFVETINGNNMGIGGVGIFTSTTAVGPNSTLNFKSLYAGDGITLTEDPEAITISSSIGTPSNVGTGKSILANDAPLQLKTIHGDSFITIESTPSELTFKHSGNAVSLNGTAGDAYARFIGASGVGESLVSKGNAANDQTLMLKSLRGGMGVNISSTGDDIIISGLMGGKYKNTVNNYLANVDDFIIGVADLTAPKTITLPSARIAGCGKMLIIKDETGTAGTNMITVVPNGVDTIDGMATYLISTNFSSVKLYSNGVNWFVI